MRPLGARKSTGSKTRQNFSVPFAYYDFHGNSHERSNNSARLLMNYQLGVFD